MEIAEEGIQSLSGRILKEMNPAADVDEMAGLTPRQRADLFSQVAVTRPDPFLTAAALQKSATQPGIRRCKKLTGHFVTVRTVRGGCTGGRNDFL